MNCLFCSKNKKKQVDRAQQTTSRKSSSKKQRISNQCQMTLNIVYRKEQMEWALLFILCEGLQCFMPKWHYVKCWKCLRYTSLFGFDSNNNVICITIQIWSHWHIMQINFKKF